MSLIKRKYTEKKEDSSADLDKYNIQTEKPISQESVEYKQTDESVEQTSASERLEQSAAVSTQIQTDQSVIPQTKSVTYQKIEHILEEDLGDLYLKMDAAHRRIFKEEGEKTAHQIEYIIKTGKSIMTRITELIKRWLKLIPGVNKFFIEQEAKIKADKILNSLKPHNHN